MAPPRASLEHVCDRVGERPAVEDWDRFDDDEPLNPMYAQRIADELDITVEEVWGGVQPVRGN